MKGNYQVTTIRVLHSISLLAFSKGVNLGLDNPDVVARISGSVYFPKPSRLFLGLASFIYTYNKHWGLDSVGHSGCNVKQTTFFHLMPWLRGKGPTVPVPCASTLLAQGQLYYITWSPASLALTKLLIFCSY
jgi:hypothetical protein